METDTKTKFSGKMAFTSMDTDTKKRNAVAKMTFSSYGN